MNELLSKLDKTIQRKFQRLQRLYIGMEVTRKSFDAGIPEEQVIVCGLDLNPKTGQENITVGAVYERRGETGVYREDYLTLEDIRY